MEGNSDKTEDTFIITKKFVEVAFRILLISDPTKVKSVDEFTEGEGFLFKTNDLKIAIVKHNDNFFAMDNKCPHAGGPLVMGEIEDLPYACGRSMLEKYNDPDEDKYPKKPALICPWHGWAFFLETGECEMTTSLKQTTYPTKVENNILYVQVPIKEKADF